MTKCKHIWHFMEKEGIYPQTYNKYLGFGFSTEEVDYYRKYLAVFVCEKCGETKKVEIKK